MRASSLFAVVIVMAGAVFLAPPYSICREPKSLSELFSRDALQATWKKVHVDLEPVNTDTAKATFWKGYERTGFETNRLPITDWSGWRSLKLDVENPYPEPFSVYVRISDRADHPPEDTYTGGTFDGYVIGPGKSTVDISLENMRTPLQRPLDPRRIAYLGIFFNPLFLRDGMDVKFTKDMAFQLANLRLDKSPARVQIQPYAEPLFKETDRSLLAEREEVENALVELRSLIEQARSRGIDTAYEDIYPYVADIVFRVRLVPFWQDRTEEQRKALNFLQSGCRRAADELHAELEGKLPVRVVPAVPGDADLTIRDGYFRLGDEPNLLFGMLYNYRGPLLRWFAKSEFGPGEWLVAGIRYHDVEEEPIWNYYHLYPDTHRVGWNQGGHIIRDTGTWEQTDEERAHPVILCLESPHSKEAIAKMIENFEHTPLSDRAPLVQHLGFEYAYVCYCDLTKKMWEEWLRRKYADLDAANRIWGTHFGDFDRVPMPRPEQAVSNRALWFDWSSFNLYRFLEHIRWTHDQVRRWKLSKPLTVGSPERALDPTFWTAVDEEELTDSGITDVVLEENYALDTLMPEYLHALAGGQPIYDIEYHGVIQQVLPNFLHGDAAMCMWWWNDQKHWIPNEPINEWPTSFPQSYTIPVPDVAEALRDALDIRRLSSEIEALASGPRAVVLLYSKTSMLQQIPEESEQIGTFPYFYYLRQIYKASQSSGSYVGLTTEKKILADDLKKRKVLILPGAEFVPENVVEKILDWVSRGGVLIVSPDSLLADEYARPTGTIQALGLRLVRRKPPQLKRDERVVTDYNRTDLPRLPLLKGGQDVFGDRGIHLQAAGERQIIECDPGLVMAHFPDGSPALIRLTRARGFIYWLTSPLEPESWSQFLPVVSEMSGLKPELEVKGNDGRPLLEVEYRVVEYKNKHLAYFYNDSDHEVQFSIEPDFAFSQIVDRRTESVLGGREVILPAGETAILEFR